MTREFPGLQYARLLRPFPVKRLHNRVLWQVLSQAHGIEQEVQRLLIDPPSTVEPWTDALWRIGQGLEVLADMCDEAGPLVQLMIEGADREYERSLEAMACILRGLPQEPAEAAA